MTCAEHEVLKVIFRNLNTVLREVLLFCNTSCTTLVIVMPSVTRGLVQRKVMLRPISKEM